MGMKSELD